MRLLRYLLVLTCILLWARLSYAQQEQVYVVQLHNGWELKGWVEYEGATLKLRTREDNLFVFDTAEVDRVEPHLVSHRWAKGKFDGPFSYPDRGYTGMVSMSVLSGTQPSGWGENFPVHSFDLQFINAYRFSRRLTLGLGTGISLYNRGPLLPIYVDARTDILDSRVTPHLYIRGGYSLALYQNDDWTDRWGNEREGEASGGLMWEAGMGMKLFTLGGTAWVFSMGVRQQASRDVFSDWGGNVISESQVFQRVVMGLAVTY